MESESELKVLAQRYGNILILNYSFKKLQALKEIEAKQRTGIFIDVEVGDLASLVTHGYKLFNFVHLENKTIFRVYKWNDPSKPDPVPAFFTSTQGVGLVVVSPDRKKFLMVKEPGKDEKIKYKLVTGWVNPGEWPQEAAVRELNEEVHGKMDDQSIVYLGCFHQKAQTFPYSNRNEECSFFGGVAESLAVEVAQEVHAVKWFDLKELPLIEADNSDVWRSDYKGGNCF